MVTPELGKRYIRRNGTITAPLVPHPHNPKWKWDMKTDYVFDDHSKGRVFPSCEEDDNDLMLEYTDIEGVDFPSDNGNDNEPLE